MKKLLTLVSLSVLSMAGIFALKPAKVSPVRAEGEEETIQVLEETVKEQKNFRETFVEPVIIALGSINVAAVASTVALFVIRHHSDKKRGLKLDDATERINKLIEESEKLKAEVNESQAKCVGMYQAQLDEMKETLELVKKTEKDCRNVEKMHRAILLLSEIEVKWINKSKEEIRSGLAKEIEELSAILEELSK